MNKKILCTFIVSLVLFSTVSYSKEDPQKEQYNSVGQAIFV
ncbi:MAG: hypothetical protein ACRCSG_04725 [Cellulosilyticaceae bacterium]